jgi:hypothetical protein
MAENESTKSFPDMFLITEEEADYNMPLTMEECHALVFALELGMVRASSEDDAETVKDFNTLYNRIQHDILEIEE